MAKKNVNPNDVEQTETGTDLNALRNNFQIGETRELRIAAVHQLSKDEFVISAWVASSDTDADRCVRAPESDAAYFPKKNDMVTFTRLEDGTMQFRASQPSTGGQA